MHQIPLPAQFRKLSVVLSCVVGTTLGSLSAFADDTEIFFSSAHGGTLSNSNILFVLDNSGSMGYDYADQWAWGEDYSTPQFGPDPTSPDGIRHNRMSDLQTTMTNLLDNIQNVNVGLMTFTYEDCNGVPGCDTRDNYAELVHPVVNIGEGNNKATLKEAVADLLPRTNTPITASLFEAAMAMRGGAKGRDPGNSYISPILSDCQQNHIVLLSDGIANSPVPKTEIENLMAGSGRSCGTGVESGQYCGLELASWMNETDHKPDGKENPIILHTVAFALNNTNFLENLAEAGGGGFRRADNAAELTTVFNEILKEVKDVDTTFVNPVTSTDRLNRLGNSTDVYFGMFTPSLKPQWAGNLKRYKLGFNNQGQVVIQDATDQDAIDPATGYFADGTRSIWSSEIDGPDVTKGGAASKITHENRNVYTYIGSDLRPTTNAGAVDLVNNSNNFTELHRNNSRLTNTILDVASDAERNTLIDWARGSDTDGLVDNPVGSSDSRRHIGDILHSTPITLNYNHANGPLIFFGTNEGFLHAIDSADGTEEYSFIPQELLGNLKLFRENSRDTPHIYGLDGSITYHHLDNADTTDTEQDGNGIVDPGETAMIYFGMRRGGRSYYAMNVSSRTQPKLSWHIKGGIPGSDFANLGQTWSKPTAARIRFQGQIKHVLIFGGGYDENQDPSNENNLTQRQSTDTMGNSIYIVDAGDGSLIWKADENSFSDMDYSIPSDINVLDIDSDGLADRLYVGDMGGQLWRFDINSAHNASDNANTLVYGGVMAKLSGNDTVENARRFYNKPDVALISKEGERFMSVSIGSGWRAHPRNTSVSDRFYMIRDNRPLHTILDSNDFGAVKVAGPTESWRPTTEADLKDITLEIDNDAIPDQEGWMLKLDATKGEKALANSLTVNNQLVFTTYIPEVPEDECLPASDSNSIYAVDVLRGNPVLPLTGAATRTIADRKEKLALNGIAPAPSAVIQKDGDSYSGGIVVGTKAVLTGLDFSRLTRRTYWHDKLRGTSEPGAISEQKCSMASNPGGAQAHDLAASGIVNPDADATCS